MSGFVYLIKKGDLYNIGSVRSVEKQFKDLFGKILSLTES